MDFNRRILPFYMTASNDILLAREDAVMQDLEYFKRLYPASVRMYGDKISSMLDKMDYEGSMIYDEYPDKMGIERLAKMIYDMLHKEEEEKDEENRDEALTEVLIYVLLCDEIYRRRHRNRRSYYSF